MNHFTKLYMENKIYTWETNIKIIHTLGSELQILHNKLNICS